MNRYQFDNAHRIWYLRAPSMEIACSIAIPTGCHVEEEFPYDPPSDDPFPGSRYFFVVNDASGAVVDYLRVILAPGDREWVYVGDTE